MNCVTKIMAPSSRQLLNGQGVQRISGVNIRKEKYEYDEEAGMFEVYVVEEQKCVRS